MATNLRRLSLQAWLPVRSAWITASQRRYLTVLLVAQTPPPIGGQAVMMQTIRDGCYQGVRILHVRMAFSHEMSEIGRVDPRKVLHLVDVTCRVLIAVIMDRPDVLYYAPSGPDVVPMLRDLFLLGSTRWLFRYTIFHFQASGISELYPQLSWGLRRLFRRAYFGADIAIRLDRHTPDDPARLRAKSEVVIPNSSPSPEVGVLSQAVVDRPHDPPVILFVGVLRESKGVLALLKACGRIRKRGIPFRLHLMGQFHSPLFEADVRALAAELEIQNAVDYLGVLTGSAKAEVFAKADIYCFLSHFESEAFPVSVVEAMSFALPVVATAWRGLPGLVRDRESGLLVPVGDAEAAADRLGTLIRDPRLAARLGRRGRELYDDLYTPRRFQEQIQAVFDRVSMKPKT